MASSFSKTKGWTYKPDYYDEQKFRPRRCLWCRELMVKTVRGVSGVQHDTFAALEAHVYIDHYQTGSWE